MLILELLYCKFQNFLLKYGLYFQILNLDDDIVLDKISLIESDIEFVVDMLFVE